MARQLIKAGYDVTVWSRSAAHVDELVADGATRATSPADAIATGHLFSMLANEDIVREVCTPARLEAAPDGFIHVNHATISAQAAEEFAGHAAAHEYGDLRQVRRRGGGEPGEDLGELPHRPRPAGAGRIDHAG